MRILTSSGAKFFSETETGSLPSRAEIEEKYKWDLSYIYKSDKEWESDFKWVEDNLSKFCWQALWKSGAPSGMP